MTPSVARLVWLLVCAALVAGLAALDATRGGPATTLSRCNLALTRADAPAADVLVVGSSRTGTAVDPVALEGMLAAEPGVGEPAVERIALGRSPLRANVALLDNYLDVRGDPAAIVFEVSFVTDRTVARIEQHDADAAPEDVLLRRDVNLLRYDQLMRLPVVTMPDGGEVTSIDRLRDALRGAVLRTGALVYQFVREPTTTYSLDGCDADAWTREPTWPTDFSFSWDETDVEARPLARIASLRAEATVGAQERQLQSWQRQSTTAAPYPYDVEEPYRASEVALLDRAVAHAVERGIPIVLTLLPTYGTSAADEDVRALADRFGDRAQVYDLYADAGVDLSTYWYDDAHLEPAVAGELTTALLAQRLVEGPLDGDPDAVAGP